MKVFDNIISKKEQKFIKNNLLDNADFPWSYVSDVSKKDLEHIQDQITIIENYFEEVE